MKLSFLVILFLFKFMKNVSSEEEVFENFHDGKQKNRLSSYSPEKLEKLLQKIDTNKDSEISKKELMTWLMDLLTMELNKRARSDLNYYDSNKDNKISLTEIFLSSYGHTEEMAEEVLKSKDPVDKEMYEYMMDEKMKFQAADLDGDGYLNHSEYKSIINPSENPKILDMFINKIILKYDLDKDSNLNETEFKLYFYVTLDLTEDQTRDFINIFKKFDFNKDGKMSVIELETWLYPGIQEAAEVESNYLIRMSDSDHNEMLTVEEIKATMQHWEASQVTNYGHSVKDEL